MAELDAVRVTAVLAPDATGHARARLAAQRYGHLDQLANAFAIQGLERIDWQHALFHIFDEELGFGVVTAHAGLGVTVFAVAAMNAWQVEDIRTMQVGESFDLNGYTVTLAAVDKGTGPNYFTTMARIDITRAGAAVATVYPEKRVYPVAAMPTTEAGIDYGFTRDIYLVIGDAQEDGSWAVRSYYKPFANWIWGGALLMAIGGMISLADRRYRIAAGERAIARGPKAVPAE